MDYITYNAQSDPTQSGVAQYSIEVQTKLIPKGKLFVVKTVSGWVNREVNGPLNAIGISYSTPGLPGQTASYNPPYVLSPDGISVSFAGYTELYVLGGTAISAEAWSAWDTKTITLVYAWFSGYLIDEQTNWLSKLNQRIRIAAAALPGKG
jgi:hypothetical protein